jgi:methionyl-tRNA synthetase
MIGQYRDGRVPSDGGRTELDDAAADALAEYRERMDEHLLHEGLEAAAGLVRRANAYVDEARPWELASEERELESAEGEAGDEVEADLADVSDELDAVLGSLARALGHCAALYAPFMPSRSRELWRQLGGAGEVPTFDELAAGDYDLGRTRPDEVLFPRWEGES